MMTGIQDAHEPSVQAPRCHEINNKLKDKPINEMLNEQINISNMLMA